MDTPIIAQYYKEIEAQKRKELLDQAIESGEDMEANMIRKELWDVRYKQITKDGDLADGYLKFWMAMEFNRNAGHKIFGSGRAQKEIRKELNDVRFNEFRTQSPLHEELLYKECEHLIRLYIHLCERDKNYNSVLCGLMTIKKENAVAKLKKDLYETAVCLPRDIGMEEELSLITKAARNVYEEQFPGEGGMAE